MLGFRILIIHKDLDLVHLLQTEIREMFTSFVWVLVFFFCVI
jgi:hypothetical protein